MQGSSIFLKRSGKTVLKAGKLFLIVVFLTCILIYAESAIENSAGIAALMVVLCISGMVWAIRHVSRDRKSDYYIEDAISDICILWFLSLVMAAVLSYSVSKHIDASDRVFEGEDYDGYACDNPDLKLLRSKDSTRQQLEDEDIYNYVEYKGKKIKDIKDIDFQSLNRKELDFRTDLFYHIDEYMFWFFDLVPLLEISKTLEICPAIETGDFGKVLRLIFKIYVIFVFFGVTRKLWEATAERKVDNADC